MQNSEEWIFPENLQPSENRVSFNLERVIDAVVKVKTFVPDDAFTANILGTERLGSGVLISGEGLIVTIGYIITEAETIWVTTNDGATYPAHIVGYDQASGFGLIQVSQPLSILPVPIEQHCSPQKNEEAYIVSFGGKKHSLTTKISDIREFTGYWEYVLDEGIYTSPPHPQWGGAGLFNNMGNLVGIGSLLLQEGFERQQQGNLVVPTSILLPILDEMVKYGRSPDKPRPWLGMYTVDSEQKFFVSSLAPSGPAALAGIKEGDQILEIQGQKVNSLANLFRSIWKQGEAGVKISITVSRSGDVLRMEVTSADRNDFLKKPRLH
ncbi:MAG: S1C family serine protease [Betaproteobacteria bacterium]